MGKKNRKKTTWRRLSLHDDSTAESSDGKDSRSSIKSADTSDSCNCHNSRNARLHSMSVKKSFLSSRKYRQYPPYHAADISSGLIGQTADDSSNSNYTASEENVFGEDQQQPVYFQPFVYPCFITPTLLLPPYHPSQWYEDPRLPYDPQNFICLTQPLSAPHHPNNSSSINSCSSPETGSDVGYSSSSPPVVSRAGDDAAALRPEEAPAPAPPLNYGDGVTTDDAYSYSHHQPPYLHQVAGVLPEDQQSPSSPPYFYSGTTYVLKPLAVVRPPPPPECWWDSDYGGGGGGGVGRRRRRRGFIGGEGITYDRWPSRIAKDPQKTEPRDSVIMQGDVVDEPLDNPIERRHNKDYSSSPVRDEVMAAEEAQVQDCGSRDVCEVTNGQNEAEIEPKVELSDDKVEVEDECGEVEVNVTSSNVGETTSLPSSLPAVSATPTDTWSSACQDPLRYSKYYQICGVDDEEMVLDEEEKVEETNNPERVSQLELMPCVDEIVVHEVGDGREGSSGGASECGSEDVEMIGHRYESGADKLYKPNTLSLAAELLGTNQQLPYDHRLKPLMERSKRVTLTSTTGYLSNTRHVMESYCSHLAVRHQAAAKMGVVCDGRPEAARPRSDGLDDDDIDVADAAEEEIIFRRSSTEANVFQPHSVSGRRYGFSPFLYLRNKGPWHGCCCSIM